MVMVFKVYGFFLPLAVVVGAMPEKKGVATFFLPRYRPAPPEPGCFGASWFLWVRPRYEVCTYKNTTCTLQNKKAGLYRRALNRGLAGRKQPVWVGMYRYLFRYIGVDMVIRLSVWLSAFIVIFRHSRLLVCVHVWIGIHTDRPYRI
ncbi:hypothetical protein [Sphingobacterium arenae]|uniref:Secreted protein n=1 Tax=Sphingobacterium arenae TaxID=1280598 RepID=A0ABR7XYB6_9SPHI|nr:hypothetical protein [Sphingobacterium arenae]MBD1424052.1 hypothetical protein [Sphingobacterium arenae]